MTLFESIRENVTARKAAEQYGLRVSRAGMAVCPFHNDRNPSMKLDDRFHCFGCGADGDAVDFVSRYFGLSLKDAAKKLAEDFSIPCDEPLRGGAGPARREPTPAEQRAKLARELHRWLEHAQDVLTRARQMLASELEANRPGAGSDAWNHRFCEALGEKGRVDAWLDILSFGTDADRLDFSPATGRR